MDPIISTVADHPAAPAPELRATFFFGEKLPRRGDWLGIGLLGVRGSLSLKIFVQFWGVNDPNFQIEQSWNWFSHRQFPVDFGRPRRRHDRRHAGRGDHVSPSWCTCSARATWRRPALRALLRLPGLVHLFDAGHRARQHVFFLYVFWELVGSRAIVLIGFFFHKNSAADANKKAFLVNRVGDFGFWLGILLFFTAIGSFNYQRPLRRRAAGGALGRLC